MSEYIVVHSVKVATDFVPETFGRLTTIGPKFLLPYGKQGRETDYQVYACTCGTTKVINCSNVKHGKSTSCGCHHKEIITKHGGSSDPVYKVWGQMKARCYNENHLEYHNYGGRGIIVCDQWLDKETGYVTFYADMGHRPQGAYSIERKLVNGNYCPENCCWETMENQQKNKRNNVMLTYNGKTQCLADWAREIGVRPNVISRRIEAGWSVEKAITAPLGPSSFRKNKKKHD